MDVNHINVLESKEQFLERVYRKGKSYEAKEQARSAINNLNYYCKEVFKKSEEEILKGFDGQNVEKVVSILVGFVEWCGKDHPDIKLDKKRTMKKKRNSLIISKKLSKCNYECHKFSIDLKYYCAIVL